DDDGAWSATAATDGNVEDGPPVVGGAPPVVGGLSANPDPVTRGDDLTLQALNVSDPDGTPTLVEFYDDANSDDLLEPGVDTLLGTDTNGADGWSISVNTTTWTAGEHTYLARAADDDGAWSAPAATDGDVENAPPVVGGLSANPDAITRGDDLTLQALNVSDPDGTLVLVEFYDDANNNYLLEPGVDTLLGRDTNGADGWSISVSTAGWSLGEHTYLAWATDDDGAWSAPAATDGNVENALPVVGGLSANTDPVTRGDDLTLQVLNVSDPDGTLVLVEFYDDANNNDLLEPGVDTLLATDTNGADGWSISVSTAGWTVGEHTYLAWATDDDGAWSVTVATDGDVEDAPPVVGGPIQEAGIWVVVGAGGAKSLTFTEDDMTIVVLTFKGGTANVRLTGDDLAQAAGKKGVLVTGTNVKLADIDLTGTSLASALTVKTKGGDGRAIGG
ncbi:hypothetical protein LCGC14_2663710, partial [marine sediment metagenome]